MAEARYHISDDGVARKCSAGKKPCRFGEDNHFDSIKDAQENYEKRQSMEQALQANKRLDSQYTDHALASDLPGYDGPAPAWLKDMVKENQTRYVQYAQSGEAVDPAQRARRFPDPKIIDTFDSEGRQVAVVWAEQSINERDAYVINEDGYNLSAIYYRDMKTGRPVGYLKAVWVDDESVKHSFGDDQWTVFRAYEQQNGSSLGIGAYRQTDPKNPRSLVKYDTTKEFGHDADHDSDHNPDKERAMKRKIWANSFRALNSIPDSAKDKGVRGYYNLTEEQAPEDDAVLDAELDQLRAKFTKSLDRFKANKQIPFIDYSNLESGYRSKGMGNSMYIYLARQLASEKNKPLSSSSLQTEYAKRTWERMAADKRIPVGTITTTYQSTQASGYDFEPKKQKNSRYVIDYRGWEGTASK